MNKSYIPANSKISPALAELINIILAAEHHVNNCSGDGCEVALYMLGLTAKRLVEHCWMHERRIARLLIDEANWH